MLTCGFFNSRDHDRKYDAVQFGSIFDGIVRDGIFMSIGDCFRVNAYEGMTVLIGVGRAWFDHTWTLNDAVLPLEIPQSEVLLNRIDAIVLDVDNRPETRNNNIIVVKGEPSAQPKRPTLIKSINHNQYPLAYVAVGERVESIRQADITNMIGTSDTPFVTGILETINTDMLLAQWGDEWKRFYEIQTGEMKDTNAAWKERWESWYNHYTKEMTDTGKYWKERWEDWFYMYVNVNTNDIAQWKYLTFTEFNEWWNSIKAILDSDIAANLAKEIVENRKRIEDLEQFRNDLIYEHAIYEPLQGDGWAVRNEVMDMDEDNVTDANGDNIYGMIYNIEDLICSDGTALMLKLMVSVAI